MSLIIPGYVFNAAESITAFKLNKLVGEASFDPGFIIEVPNGGTGITSYAQGDMIYSPATDTLARLPKSTATTRYLSNTGASNNPAWAQVDLTNGVIGVLPPANGGAGAPFFTSIGPSLKVTAGALDVIQDVRITASPTFRGPLTITSPSTTANALNATGPSGAFAAALIGSSVASNSYGLYTQAGSNTSDYNLLLTNKDGSTLGYLRGDGAFAIAGNAVFGGIQNTPIGSVTPSTGNFTTINASGLIWSVADQEVFRASGGNPGLAKFFYINTGGGNKYFGVEDSAGGTFGATPYSYVHYNDNGRPFEWFINGSRQMQVNGAGINATPIGASSPSTGVFTSVRVTGGSFATGSLYYNGVHGLVIAGAPGTTNDVLLTNSAAGLVMHVPTGTTNAIFDGNVGIGTTTPGQKLQLGSGSEVAMRLNGPGVNWDLHAESTGDFTIENGNGPYVRFNKGVPASVFGFPVGIGTPTPTAQLHTTGSVRFEAFGAGTLQTDASGYVSAGGGGGGAGTIKAWVRFLGTTGAIISSFGIASVTRTSPGNYNITFSVAFADTLYAVIGIAPDAARVIAINSYGTSVCQMATATPGASASDSVVVHLMFLHT